MVIKLIDHERKQAEPFRDWNHFQLVGVNQPQFKSGLAEFDLLMLFHDQ
jgi:hypothetical protein